MISMERELLQTITTPFSCHKPENSILAIFGHFSPFVPAHGRSLNPTSAFIEITIITGCCCNNIHRKRATPGYYNPIFPPYASNSIFGHFWLFLTIFDHFWPFLTIFAYSWATPWSHLCFYLLKCYHWVLFQWDLWREPPSSSLSTWQKIA